ncbi:hypothetical protein PAECIP111893_03463 [Paenibacillus plantiphilus]|uniref:Uncharacterized protein n=1 Tax=Paenibacillus plantiphilus TaxID=2905650 RepID=A0ABN8GL43_9BACL|nr:hypothetical protein [Paenibacillus plantiphilus]CAH1211719.1 hypothetical protein PAECIP111893_03463 [Paenibacillus plantiphilus]
MDTYLLEDLTLTYDDQTSKLQFTSAVLVIVTEASYRLWYIEIDGMTQIELLQAFLEREDIRVDLSGVTAGGLRFEGIGYLHPNVAHHAAAIRGDDELTGFLSQ